MGARKKSSSLVKVLLVSALTLSVLMGSANKPETKHSPDVNENRVYCTEKQREAGICF